MGGDGLVPGSARLHLIDGLPLLRPDEQVFEAMIKGWRNQQLTRNLLPGYVGDQERTVRAFTRHADAMPWQWTPQHVDEWSADLRAVHGCVRSTLRNYHGSVRQFCDFLTNPAYGWSDECLRYFGTHPVQVVHDWNAATHADEAEGEPERRAFTRPELEAFFDHADEEVLRVRGKGRKGWLPAFRDAALFKTAYAYGLRRNETRMLDLTDFGRNPEGREFGEYGTLLVRYGKAKKGSPPKRRSVLTVWHWTPGTIGRTPGRCATASRTHPASVRGRTGNAWTASPGRRPSRRPGSPWSMGGPVGRGHMPERRARPDHASLPAMSRTAPAGGGPARRVRTERAEGRRCC
ncbi:hypothetical protein [Streptomyces sp. NPDC048386]|uniref:hypothetical protein n=1 Tax=Streptomyces sp. NPDC048386 TaxID=3365541 RepID=UPI003719174C